MASARQPARKTPPRQEPPRQSRAYHRRQEEAREERFQRRVTIAAILVLALAGILVAGGYIVTTYIPAHTRVLTVGNRSFEAQAIPPRAALFATRGDPATAAAAQRDPVAGTLDALAREETLLQAGASQVDPLKDEEIHAVLEKRLGVQAGAPLTVFDRAYKEFLAVSPVPKATFEQREVRAAAIADKLAAKFRAALPDAGVQVHLQGAESANKAQVQALFDATKGGTEFTAAALQAGIVQKVGDADYGWVALDQVPKIKNTLAPLQAGQTSDVVQLANGDWAVYRVVERDDQRKYEDVHKDQIAKAQVATWVESQREPLHITRNVPSRVETWMLKEIRRIVSKMQAAAAKQATP